MTGARQLQRDLPRVGVGSQPEVVLELALVPVEAHVDPRPYAPIGDLRVGRHVGMPTAGILADQIVDPARQPPRGDHRRPPAAHEAHPQCGGRGPMAAAGAVPGHGERRSPLGQGNRIAVPTSGESDARSVLTPVRLESERQAPVGRGELPTSRRGQCRRTPGGPGSGRDQQAGREWRELRKVSAQRRDTAVLRSHRGTQIRQQRAQQHSSEQRQPSQPRRPTGLAHRSPPAGPGETCAAGGHRHLGRSRQLACVHGAGAMTT